MQFPAHKEQASSATHQHRARPCALTTQHQCKSSETISVSSRAADGIGPEMMSIPEAYQPLSGRTHARTLSLESRDMPCALGSAAVREFLVEAGDLLESATNSSRLRMMSPSQQAALTLVTELTTAQTSPCGITDVLHSAWKCKEVG